MKTVFISVLSGAIISLALFWLMQYMITNQQQGFEQTDNLYMTEFVRLKRQTKIESKQRKTPEPPKPKDRPPPPSTQIHKARLSQTKVTPLAVPNLDIPLQTSDFSGSVMNGVQIGAGVGGGQISRNIMPLVRIPPRYPMRAANRGIEGWVKVEFTITEQGTVKDAVVVDSQPGNIFNRAALRAIKRWKFKPKVIDGVAFEQRAVQVLQFKLSK